jgi:hypothetical protein
MEQHKRYIVTGFDKDKPKRFIKAWTSEVTDEYVKAHVRNLSTTETLVWPRSMADQWSWEETTQEGL